MGVALSGENFLKKKSKIKKNFLSYIYIYIYIYIYKPSSNLELA
jgi:hypothetical protein